MELGEFEEVLLHQCSKCDKNFPALEDLEIHNQKVHLAKKQIFEYWCIKCEINLNSDKDLIDHMKTENHEKNPQGSKIEGLQCTICQQKFSRTQTLDNHIKTVHENVKNYFCENCGKSYSDQSSLRSHIKDKHKDLKPHKCDSCNKAFNRKHTLKQHVKIIHEKARDHMCKNCSKSFSTKSNLVDHIKSFHEKDEFSYQCIKCDKHYQRKRHYLRHFKSLHTDENNYTCNECGKVLRGTANLEKHVQIKHGLENLGNYLSNTNVD